MKPLEEIITIYCIVLGENTEINGIIKIVNFPVFLI